LIDNAIKHTPPGGQVSVHSEQNAREVVTSIHDSGPGIPADHLPFLFDRFYRVEADRSRLSGGAGLGLAIAHEIATVHHGEIEVRSELGHGTTFVVHLPLQQP
jgi:two-component system sensor histidine kinase BaeS